MNVLIADDTPESRLLLQRLLEKAGHTPIACSNGAEVVHLIESGELPSIVVLDWMMPDIDGSALVKKIRERKDTAHVYIIMLTVRDQRDDVVCALRDGVNDYLIRPLKAQDLYARLGIAIGHIETQRALLEQRARVEAASRLVALSDMAAGMAHEINNPLAIISGNIHILRNQITSDVAGNRAFEAVERAIVRIAQNIRALRFFASPDKDNKKMTSLKTIVDAVLSFCHERLKNSGLRVDVIQKCSRCDLVAHERHLTEALFHLLQNAYLAVKDQREREICIEIDENAESYELAVVDSGPGVPREIRHRIMEPFYTTRKMGQGIGLGLSVTKDIAELHGGSLFLDTNSQKTRFVMRLPHRHGSA